PSPADGGQPAGEGGKPSAGQVVLVPVQVSEASRGPAATRRTVPALPAGCVHAGAPAVPLHTSEVQTLPSSVQAVPAGWTASGGQLTLVPVQVSARSHSLTAARHTVPEDANPSAGQVLLEPVQVAATAQASAAARHCVPAAMNVQSVLQQSPLVPLLAPSSHCSPLSPTPFPQPAG